MRNIKKRIVYEHVSHVWEFPHTSKVMRGQPQPYENTNLERIPFRLHLAQQNVFVPYEIHMIK